MSVDGWNTLLVLGGIRSGKSEFAESLVSGATSLRYLATSASPSEEDPEWQERIAAHRDRRPETWETEETAADPGRLIATLTEAKPDETLLVDDLGGWVGVLLDPAYQPSDDGKTIQELAAAVRGCAARLVLVSPEVGLSLVPATTLGRAFADALGTVNQAVAAAVDAVVLVVAGQPTWLKEAPPALAPSSAPAAAPVQVLADVPAPIVLPEVITPVAAPPAPAAAAPAPASPAAAAPASAAPASAAPASAAPASAAPAADALRGPTQALPMVRTGLVIQPNMELPLPDEETGPAALDRLATLDIAGTGLGELAGVVRFAAATQGTDTPRPWQSVRVLLVQGDHAGGASAGTPAGESGRRTAQARLGVGALAQLTAAAGATLQIVDAPAAAAVEDGPALTLDEVDDALRLGWRLAEEAAENGADLLVIAAGGDGAPAAAAAVLAATAGAEPSAVLPPVRTPEGDFDDNAWMARCAAVRDAMQRVRKGSREAKDILAEVGGGDVAVVTGILLGATARRTPVLLDGPIGVAAALVSRDLAGQARHWCLLPDHGGDPAVKLGADVLGLTPVLNMRLGLGEGTTALAALPLLRSAIALAASIPPRTDPSSTPDATGPATGTSWPADGLDAADAAGAASAGAAGLLAEAAVSASTTTAVSTSDDSAGGGTDTGDDSAVALASAVGVVAGEPAGDRADGIGAGDTYAGSRDTTTVITGTGTGGPDADTTTVIGRTGGSDADTTTVIGGAGGSDADATAVIRLPGSGDAGSAGGDAGTGAYPASTAAPAPDDAEDEAERTAVLSVVPPAGAPDTGLRVPATDDPEATTVIPTGSGPARAEENEDSNSWLPGFGNPRRSDDPDAPATR
ncbi:MULTISPECIES: bifunctional adenosylcobinamide kinase/adenosylcobinamide-phosphate guanylyltransferase [Catenuloplanes]|uniref:Adenosylcobinamide kinase n=1 Tax=Catenuloplanes niger TaxID=587534 RepID=A0AAE3ZMW6_9ACTN|nr:nicotinate-nucleotide--dimethylbenzimidazole phosphoribosyltransferase [Catenuloplanes niger]